MKTVAIKVGSVIITITGPEKIIKLLLPKLMLTIKLIGGKIQPQE